jgi:hypothetical protein
VFRSFAGTAVLMTVENKTVATEAGLLFSYYIILSFWAAQGLGMSLLSRNVAGQTKKSVAVTMNFVAWAVGNAIGEKDSIFGHIYGLTMEKVRRCSGIEMRRAISSLSRR